MEFAKFQMSQFKLKDHSWGIRVTKTDRKLEAGLRVDSIAYVHFFVERQAGYFLLQVVTTDKKYNNSNNNK